MTYDECELFVHVRINTPSNPILHGETGVICNVDGDTVEVRFDQYNPKFDSFGDTRTGSVSVYPDELEKI
jgi:ribosomal protein L21E